MTQNIHQSDIYAQFMRAIGWVVEEVDGVKIFIKKFPLLPAVMKIQRADKVPDIQKLKSLMKKYRARSISFEPSLNFKLQNSNFKLLSNPYLPTKTIHIDITPPQETIFKRFSEAKQRGVRRAQKGGIKIEESKNIQEFITLKNKTAGVLGFLTTTTVQSLWQAFAPKHAAILVALISKKPLAGILLLFHQKTAYYWMAAATREGKKAFAPTLLVWEALKLAKEKGCTTFDFEGIYDERFPKLNKNWLGFTKFKQGFGGKEVNYSQPFLLK